MSISTQGYHAGLPSTIRLAMNLGSILWPIIISLPWVSSGPTYRKRSKGCKHISYSSQEIAHPTARAPESWWVYLETYIPLQWRYNERDGVSIHRRLCRLPNRFFFRRRSKKHQSSASLAFVRGIHRSPVDSPHKGPVTRKMFPLDDVIMPCKN